MAFLLGAVFKVDYLEQQLCRYHPRLSSFLWQFFTHHFPCVAQEDDVPIVIPNCRALIGMVVFSDREMSTTPDLFESLKHLKKEGHPADVAKCVIWI